MIQRYGKNKYAAVKTKRDGKTFHSKIEARYYDQLKLRQMAGEVKFFLTQVPFALPGNVKYVADFAIFLSDGTVEFIDVKGRDTPLSKTKRKMVEDLYPVTIKIITKV